MLIKKVNINGKKEVELTCYLLDSSKEYTNITTRPAVLIFPGGGYHFTSDREAEPIAMSYLAEGFNAFVLRYSTGEGSNFEEPLKDSEAAMTLIRDNADKWNIDKSKIAVIGFSAGGHLAAALGTMGENKPNALILGYPCILSSMNYVLAFPVPSLDKEVDKTTPPTFLFTTFEDELVPVKNTLSFMQALNENNIPFESHIFQKGGHGLSLAKSLTSNGLKAAVNPDFSQWFDMSVSWLHNIFGNFPADIEISIPKAEDVGQFSIHVQLDSLLEHPDCRKVLLDNIPVLADERVRKRAKNYSLKLVNQHIPEPVKEEKLLKINEQLKAIPFNK